MSLHEPKPMPAARELRYIAASQYVNCSEWCSRLPESRI